MSWPDDPLPEARRAAKRSWPAPGLPMCSQHVVVLCAGVHCTERVRSHMLVTPGSYPERLFRDGSPFLGAPELRWTGAAWEWHVLDAGPDDAAHVRKLLNTMCPPRPDARRVLDMADERVREIAQQWGLLRNKQ